MKAPMFIPACRGRLPFSAFKIVLAVSLCTLALTCKKPTEPPPPGEQPLTFEALDASCTEVWLEVKFHPDTQTRTIEIRRDTLPILTTSLTGTDTLIVDEGLLPNSEYTYTLTRPGAPFGQALTTTITTMDTTDHNAWVFDQPLLLGDGSSSILYDVCILSDTLAYAVGAVYKLDSLGNWDPLPYNLVKWDGQQCELKRVTVMYRGSPITPPLNAIFAFSPTDIWLSSGVPIRGDGQNWTQYHLFDMGILTQNDGSINKIWGTEGSIYFVGNRGTIVHYISGPGGTGTWRRVESGVTLRVQDAWGVRNAAGDQKVIAVASNKFTNDGVAVMALHAGSVQSLSVAGLPTTSVVGVWSANGLQYHVCGDGLYVSNNLHGGWREIAHGAALIYMEAVRGTAPNDIVIAGDFGFLIHWNGVRWREYSNNVLPYFAGQYEAVDVEAQLMVAVGWLNSGRAIMLTGRR